MANIPVTSFLPRVENRGCRSVDYDVLNPEISQQENSAIRVLSDLKEGKITVSDLMGPLYGETGLTTSVSLPPGSTQQVPAAAAVHFEPKDEFNDILDNNVHPTNYMNPEPVEIYDLVVIGAGVSGLLSVITGKWLGKRCALIESHAMGGDCLNIGCVPSKALLAASRALSNVRDSEQFGVILPPGEVKIDFGAVMRRMRKIRSEISAHDSVERYSRDFCEHVYVGRGVFSSDAPNTVVVTGDDGSTRQLKYKKAMIATGASASIPPPLLSIPHLTNANFFNLTELPPRMVVVGCGPIGLEMSQAMAVFGTRVTCLEFFDRVLPREDPDAASILLDQLKRDGIQFMLQSKVTSVELAREGSSLYCAPWPLYRVTVENTVTGETELLECEAILNATGRVPNVFNIGLENVGVTFDSRNGVHINDAFQTANRDIYSCGDCATVYKFTHSADFQARLAVRNMFLGDANRLSDMLIPWCTYTHPEIAHVGKYESELDKEGVDYESFKRDLPPVDRCRCDGVEAGFVKITVAKGTDKILGSTICGPNAGDMIAELTLCMQYGIGVAELAGTIHCYPTTQEAVRQCALQYYKYYKDPNGLPMNVLNKLMAEVESQST